MGDINAYCASFGLTSLNFSEILDQSKDLSLELAACIAFALREDKSIEESLLDFINSHQNVFLKRPLNHEDKQRIKERFTKDYAEIKDSLHFDEFLLLDSSHPGLFVEHQGSIAVDFAQFAGSPTLKIDTPYFEQIRKDFQNINRKGVVSHKNEHIDAKIDINLEQMSAPQLKETLKKFPPRCSKTHFKHYAYSCLKVAIS